MRAISHVRMRCMKSPARYYASNRSTNQYPHASPNKCKQHISVTLLFAHHASRFNIYTSHCFLLTTPQNAQARRKGWINSCREVLHTRRCTGKVQAKHQSALRSHANTKMHRKGAGNYQSVPPMHSSPIHWTRASITYIFFKIQVLKISPTMDARDTPIRICMHVHTRKGIWM